VAEKPQRVYANVMGIKAGPFDVAMDFGSRAGEEDPDYEVRVMMSWTHLKLMVAVLQQQIASYESQLGELPELTVQPDSPEEQR
jgi:hypothetical protein